MSNSSTASDSPLAEALRAHVLEGFEGPGSAPWESNPTWDRLEALGTELWLDTGDIDVARELWVKEFKALTTNNTLLNREIQKGLYDARVPGLQALLREVAPELDEKTRILETAFALNAIHGLKLVETFGVQVSVELHTDLAHDLKRSVQYGLRYHAICPSHFIVKVPLTAEGLLAARKLGQQGVRINFTLGFSARQNLLIASVANPDFCNVFMGRINAFLIDNKLGDGVNAGEKATALSGNTMVSLRQEGRAKTRQIGASMRGPNQVEDLAGLDVYTMPPKVAQDFLALGKDPSGIERGVDGDFPVQFAEGVDAAQDQLEIFWTLDERTNRAMEGVSALDLDNCGPEDILSALSETGSEDLLPDFDGPTCAALREKGKIPSYAAWVEEVRAGNLAWDSLLTQSGLLSFAEDQRALDERIQSLLPV
ncbi:MAG TPA: transaldolase [Planctomycetes bacterium]|nr:transaldolase [Planctomycetota bacterium]